MYVWRDLFCIGLDGFIREIQMAWEYFSLELLQRYGGDVLMDPCERLAAIKQEGSVEEYIGRVYSTGCPRESTTSTIWVNSSMS